MILRLRLGVAMLKAQKDFKSKVIEFNFFHSWMRILDFVLPSGLGIALVVKSFEHPSGQWEGYSWIMRIIGCCLVLVALKLLFTKKKSILDFERETFTLMSGLFVPRFIKKEGPFSEINSVRIHTTISVGGRGSSWPGYVVTLILNSDEVVIAECDDEIMMELFATNLAEKLSIEIENKLPSRKSKKIEIK